MNDYIYDSLDKDDALIREYPNYEKETKENDIMAEVGGKIDVLDKGYVRLADVMGSDHSVASAARVSYDKETEELTEGDIRLIKFLAREGHCYDADTEVLTDTGFVKWPEVTFEHNLAAVDPGSGKLKGFEKPIDIVREDYAGQVISLETPDVSLKVTEGHSLYAALIHSEGDRRQPKFSLTPANKNVESSNGAPAKKVWEKPMRLAKVPSEKEDGDANKMFALYGFFIGDGHAPTRNTISFHLTKDRKIKFIRDLAQDLGWELRELANDKYSFTMDGLGQAFKEMFYSDSGSKTFPDKFFKMGASEYQGLKIGLEKSDGHLKRGTTVFDTSSPELADKIQTIAAINGDVVSVNEGISGMFRLNFNSRRTMPRVNDTENNRMVSTYEELTVYCATVSTGLLVIRRNGKTLLCGNTSPFRHAFATFEVYAPLMVARQWWKYVAGSDHTMDSWNESSRRYITEEPAFYIPQPDEWRSKPANSKQGSGDIVPVEVGEVLTEDLMQVYEIGERAYENAMVEGIAPEQARLFLPAYGMYVRWRWSASLQSIAHFLNQRLEHDSQYEIQQYAKAVLELIKPHFEHSIAELVDIE